MDETITTKPKRLSARAKFWMAIANIPCTVIAFYVPLPESLSEFETASYLANWVIIAASLGFALYYARQFKAEQDTEFAPSPGGPQ